MSNLFSLMLILAGLLSFVVFILEPTFFVPLYVGIIFILVAFFNAFLEFYQELKSKQVLEGFQSLIEHTCLVIRDGQKMDIPTDDVVAGDLVLLKAGDVVPADCRIVGSSTLKVDMSSLTGESVPIMRDAETSTLSPDKAANLLFKSSAVTSGACIALVFRVGHRTLIGTIMRLSMGELVEQGELGKEIEILIRRIVLAAVTTGSLIMGVAFIQGVGVVTAFDAAIGIFVAFLPQGLPMTITILLTSAAKRMAARNVLVKNLQAVETLGSLTVIATDKTGTLTKNQMEVIGGVIHGHLYDNIYEAGDGVSPILECFGGSTIIKLDPSVQLDETLEGIYGDATELGLIRFALKAGLNLHDFNRTCSKILEIPFDSARKWNLAVCQKPDGSMMAYLKGAPDKIVPGCSNVDAEGFKERYRYFAGKGQRLIGFARKPLHSQAELDFFRGEPNDLKLEGFEYVGMVSLYDPPKEGVKEAVEQLKDSGIRVFMVTGDHPITAMAIAQEVSILSPQNQHTIIESMEQVGLLGTSKSLVLHGDLVDEMTDEHWDILSKAEEIVFSRTLPRHKLMIVKRMQSFGEIVGAIGDGVNDSPAIKKANLGISMNKTGSDISKEAATMILLDDKFSTITHGVYEGRLIYQNLKKSIRYTLTHIMPEITAFGAWVIFLIPPPLTPILVLMIDVGSELGPALSYAYEPPEMDLFKLKPRKKLVPMKEKPNWFLRTFIEPFRLRQKGESLLDSEMVGWVYFQGGIIESIGCFGAYLITFAILKVPLSSLWRAVGVYFYPEANPLTLTNDAVINGDQQVLILKKAQGAYYLAIVIGQLFNLFMTKTRYGNPFNKRILKNRATYIGAACAVLIAALVVFVPGLQYAFQTYFIAALAIASPFVAGIILCIWEFFRHKIQRSVRKQD